MEKLRNRCDVLERVTRAVGRFGYADRAEPLLLNIFITILFGNRGNRVGMRTISYRYHSVHDNPCMYSPDGDREWRSNGVRHRNGGPSRISVYRDYRDRDGTADVLCEKWYSRGVFLRETEIPLPYKFFSQRH